MSSLVTPSTGSIFTPPTDQTSAIEPSAGSAPNTPTINTQSHTASSASSAATSTLASSVLATIVSSQPTPVDRNTRTYMPRKLETTVLNSFTYFD